MVLDYIPEETLVGTLNVSGAHEPSCRVLVLDIFAGQFSICTRCDDNALAGCVLRETKVHSSMCTVLMVFDAGGFGSDYDDNHFDPTFQFRSASILPGSSDVFSCVFYSSWLLRHRLACHTGVTNVRIAREAWP